MHIKELFLLAIKANKRMKKNTNFNNITFIICGIFCANIVLLLAFLSSLFDSQINMLFNLGIFFLVIGYNLPIIKYEFHSDNLKLYKTSTKNSINLLIFLVLENNLLLPISLFYLIVYILLNILKLVNILVILTVISVLVLYLLMYISLNLKFKFTAGIILFIEFITIFINDDIIKLLFIFLVVNCLFSNILLRRIKLERKNIFELQIKSSNKIFFISLPVKRLFITGYEIFKIIIIFIFANLLKNFSYVRLSELLFFIVIFELELHLDKKFKDFRRNKAKFNFIKLSHSSIIRRIMLSEIYWIIFITSIYIFIADIVTAFSGCVLIFDLFVNIILGLCYFWAEERMFKIEEKTNNIFFQYIIFVSVFLYIFVMNYFL